MRWINIKATSRPQIAFDAWSEDYVMAENACS